LPSNQSKGLNALTSKERTAATRLLGAVQGFNEAYTPHGRIVSREQQINGNDCFQTKQQQGPVSRSSLLGGIAVIVTFSGQEEVVCGRKQYR